ncbi:MAG: hypothetical protein HC886_13750 [Leptolyngbyaceae cyanobacterium SM1_1_3]|nr:hypothetical protein [Leptolyngbyaceae cyanobacterium SM1_1_3]NJM85405.1 hypothetical protein [Leptolyngbyaceae cyanobacterium RM2_2_21]NJN02606.1 hypothetical protein [Leptolyngbyaceae cyanobacterium RM1_1_2]NJO10827.1 hypothetical protein [Leptolyngbyaceae cyanobacterium SL_1_1]
MSLVPTLDDIFDLARQIEVPLPEWLRQTPNWSTVLHELSHWAVKPDSYIQRYLEKIKPYAPFIPVNSIPGAEEVMPLKALPTVRWRNGGQGQLRFNHVFVYELDPTPNEFGARAWGLQVLDQLGWCHPMECAECRNSLNIEFGDAQFDTALLCGDSHPISTYGPDQLNFMGIDIANGRFRPQVEVDFDGQWIRVYRGGALVWSLDILAGFEVVEWEPLAPNCNPGKPLLLEEVLAIAERC